MKYNLNSDVRIILTYEGKIKLKEFRDSMLQEFPEFDWDTYIPNGNQFKCQFWELFDIFGGNTQIDKYFLMDVELL